MSLCQIVSFGREHQWLKIGLKEHPRTRLLLIITNEKGKDYKYYNEALKLKKELENEQETFPEEYKTKIEVLNFEPFRENYFALFCFILEVVKKIALNYNEIIINATSGLQLLKLVLFQVTLMNKEIIKEYFIYNKEDNKKQAFWLQEKLSESEWEVLKIIAGKKKPSISDIEEDFTKGQLSYVLKIVKSLAKNNLITEKKEGRQKLVELSEMGKALTGTYLKENEREQLLKF